MPFVTIRLLLNMYTSNVTKVMWVGIYSKSFLVKNGVKQGGIVGPILFAYICMSYLRGLKIPNLVVMWATCGWQVSLSE